MNQLYKNNQNTHNKININQSYNIQQQNIVCKSQINKIIKLQQLKSQADQIFSQHTKSHSQKIKKLKKQQKLLKKQNKQSSSQIIPNDQLKYYLKQDIKRFCQKVQQQNIQNHQNFKKIFQQIKRQLQLLLPITVLLYGSYATKLHLALSDIDLVIIPRQQCSLNARQIFEIILQKLQQMKQIIGQTIFLDKASVPIIKASCTGQYKFKSIDISFQHQYHNGLKAVNMINLYLKIYPQLKKLILVLKNFIYQAKLYGPYSGGLSSYGLILMIFAYIQNQQKQNPTYNHNTNQDQELQKQNIRKDSNSKQQNISINDQIILKNLNNQYSLQIQENNKNIVNNNNKIRDLNLRAAQLLIGFLKFYGFKMDYFTQKIIIINAPQKIYNQNCNYKKCTIYNPEWRNQFPPQPKLIIMDPLSLNNNVGKHTRRIRQIKMSFQLAYLAIHTNRRCTNKRFCQSYKIIKNTQIPQIKYKQNKKPCCILQRMFKCTDKFDINKY